MRSATELAVLPAQAVLQAGFLALHVRKLSDLRSALKLIKWLKRPAIMSCQVIGAGWCRTGTSSLQVALEQLGFAPCFHSRLLPYLPSVRDACYEHSRGRAREFPVERIFGFYRAAVDLPAALIPLLLDAYPDAKVPPCGCKHDCPLPAGTLSTCYMLIYTINRHV